MIEDIIRADRKMNIDFDGKKYHSINDIPNPALREDIRKQLVESQKATEITIGTNINMHGKIYHSVNKIPQRAIREKIKEELETACDLLKLEGASHPRLDSDIQKTSMGWRANVKMSFQINKGMSTIELLAKLTCTGRDAPQSNTSATKTWKDLFFNPPKYPPMDFDALIDEFKDAFPTLPCPGFHEIVAEESQDDELCVRDTLAGQRWDELADMEVEHIEGDLCFLTPEALHYYFPAFLLHYYRYPHDHDWIFFELEDEEVTSFTAKQRACICAFLEWFLTLSCRDLGSRDADYINEFHYEIHRLLSRWKKL